VNGSGQASDQILGRNNIGGRPFDRHSMRGPPHETFTLYIEQDEIAINRRTSDVQSSQYGKSLNL